MISQVNAGELRDGIGTSSTRQPRGQREVTVIFHDHLRLPVGVGGGGLETVRTHASSSELWSKGLEAHARWLKVTDCGEESDGGEHQ